MKKLVKKGAISREQTTTDKDEELDVKHVVQVGEAELLKDRAGAWPLSQIEEAIRSPCQRLHVAYC